MKKIVAINASPRASWNTGILAREAASGAGSEGADIEVFDLYRLGKFSGCISCFRCKLPEHKGHCVCQDGLTPVLESVRRADGLIIGTPNYLGDVTAGFRALYERLIFQYITYNASSKSSNDSKIPILFIMTSNVPEESYQLYGYDRMVSGYQSSLDMYIGPTKVMICGDTLQVSDYSKYDWSTFDPEAKQKRHETVFPAERQKAFSLGAALVREPWQKSE